MSGQVRRGGRGRWNRGIRPPVRRFFARLANLDAREWRAVILTFLLFGGLGCVALLVAPALGLTGPTGLARWLRLLSGPWGLPAAVAAFAGLAFLGAPQVALIAATALVFGPWRGSLYSWVGTFASALIGYELGRAFGARLVADFRSRGVDRFLALVSRHGFATSLVIRLVPAAPFIVVNMAAGTARVRRRDFALGTAVGILPKILLTAFAGGTLGAAMRGQGAAGVGLLAAAAMVWVFAVILARRWLKSRETAKVVAEPADIG
jgi:uncharacterized membrane protein YdjX (TVP38/TMEM64 family)